MDEIRLDCAWPGARLEVTRDFDGAPELERSIVEARARGDSDEAHRLEREHRDRRLGTTRSISMPTSEPRISTPTPTTIAKPDSSRSIVGYGATFRATLPCRIKHGDDRQHLLRLSAASLRDWVSGLDFSHEDECIPACWAHGHADRQEPVGHVVAAVLDHIGLLVEIELRESVVADIQRAGNQGQLALSVNARVLSAVDTGERLGGLAIWESTAAGCNEISVLYRQDAGDESAIITQVAGQRAAYLRAQERDVQLEQTYRFPDRRGPSRRAASETKGAGGRVSAYRISRPGRA